ncbi:MAG TPA: CHASE domain-containing protein [Ignavibacteriales bacterium]|nr:CHASE domain-containing protein [Ignavibacteriales bacterium]
MSLQQKVYKYSNFTAIAALIFFLGLTAWLWMDSRHDTQKNANERFEFRVYEIKQVIQQRMQEYEKILLGGVGLFDVAKPVTRQMWHDYVERLRISETSPGIQGIGFSILLRPQDLPSHQEKVRREGYTQYHVWPGGNRDLYTSIVYLEPFSGLNLRAFGYDMYSEPVRQKAMSKAMDSGLTALTGKVRLVQEGNTAVQSGFLMYVPVYRKGVELNTVQERRSAIIGFVYSPFRMNDLINGIFGSGLTDIQLKIYDGELPTKRELMYNSGFKGEAKDTSKNPLFRRSEQVIINGHTWTLQFSTLPMFERTVDSQKSPIILFSGIIISLLFAAVVKSLSSTRARALALGVEINERKRAEEALKESEERFRLITENANDLVSVRKKEGSFVYTSPSFSKRLGFSPEELLNMRISDLVHPDEIAKFINRVNPSPVQFRIHTAKGEWIWMEGTSSIMRMRDEDFILGIAREITERKMAEDALKEEMSRAETLIKVSNTFAELTLDYKAVLENAAKIASELIGDAAVVRLISDDNKYLEPAAVYHPDNEAVKLIYEVLRSVPQESGKGLSGRVLATSESLIIQEKELQENKNSIRPEYTQYFKKYGVNGILVVPLKVGRQLIGTLSLIRTRPGKPYTSKDRSFLEELANRVAIAIANSRLHQEKVHEIDERRLAEEKLTKTLEELARSNSELENFAYVASHDLQEPLRMISSYTQLIAKRYKGQLDEKADQFIAFTVDGAKRMQQLIHDLLEYSRVATRGKPFAAVDAGEIIRTVLNNLQISIKNNNAVITYGSLPRVVGDDIQLMQLFQNLISNSMKFRSNKVPEITVKAEDRGQEWLFSVHDNGIGIDPQFKERIFIIFQRLHEREEYPGTGIGLAVCKKIVERHGGRIWVESEPGEGSTFFFTLPKKTMD